MAKGKDSLIGAMMILGVLATACSSMVEKPTEVKSASSAKGASRAPASFSEKSQRRERRPNAVLIKLRTDASAEQLAALKSVYEEADLRHEKYLLNKKAARLRIHKPQYLDQEEQVVDLIKVTGAAEFVEPDYVVPMALAPNDPFYNNQWHHGKIKSETAWGYTTGVSSVQVALCDSGFDVNHPELASRFVLPGYNTVKDNSQIDSINAHGTMTSGVIGAIGNNGIGVAGMAWNVRLLPIQITDRADGASTYSDIAECIRYAGDHGAKVVNISYDYVYTSAIVNDAAAFLRAAGGLVVVSAGNGATDISAWGPSLNLVVVGATDSSDTITGFSNYGTPVDLVAPGASIYTTTVSGEYSFASGTSFSAPIVSGVAALIYSLKPSFSPNQVEQFILSTATDLGPTAYDLTYAGGRINADLALQAAAAAPAPKIILDNLAAKASDDSRQFTGKWCNSQQAGAYGNDSLLSCGSGTGTYRFTPSIATARAYQVFIRYLAKPNRARKAPVLIKTASGTVTRYVNMQTGGGTWTLLGTYNLSAGQGNYVELNDSAGTVSIDGVMFEPPASLQ